MNIDKAIEIGEKEAPWQDAKGYHETAKAIQLLIEAGKREKANRDNPSFVMVGQLPGETEE